MATSPRKLSKDERDIVMRALDMLYASQLRASRFSVDPDVAEVQYRSALRTDALRSVFRSGELEI